MPEYKKIGYLTSSFKLFHLKDQHMKQFRYHYHDFHKILILLNGNLSYCIEGRTYELTPGDIVLVNAGEVHRPILHSADSYERIILYVSPDFLAEHSNENYNLGLCFTQAHEKQAHVLRNRSGKTGALTGAIHALDSSAKELGYASELHHTLMFLDFLIHLNRAALDDQITFVSTASSGDKMLPVLDFLNEHLTEDISIDALAGRFYLSRSYLMHTFKEQTGYTIGSYLSTKRLLYAKELIVAGKPITEVCFTCGFRNYSTFSRAYKKSFGESPRDYRQSLS
jgi:AraC-like DNA-binding protein